MRQLKQSTQRDVMVFMTDSSDHITGKTGLTLTITASKNGAAFASITPTVTERGTGWYALTLTTTHTNTIGDLALHVTSSGADPSDLLCEVVLDLPGVAQTGDSFVLIGTAGAGLTALGDTRIANLDGTITSRASAADLSSLRDVADEIRTSQHVFSGILVDASAMTFQYDTDASAVDDNYIGCWALIVSGTGAGTAPRLITDYNGSSRTGVIGQAWVTTPTTGSVVDIVPASQLTWNADWNAEVQSEANDAIVANKLDHLVAVADADDVVDNSIIAKMVSKSATADWSSFVNTTDSLEAVRDRGDTAWITATGFSTHSAADVWSVATRVLTAGTNIQLPSNGLANVTAWTVNITGSLSGSVGSVTGNVGGNLTGTIGGLTDQAKADVNAECDTALTDYDAATGAEFATIPTAVQNADALLGRNVAGGSSTGRTVSQALYALRNKVTISGTTLTVYQTDDSTTSWTATLTLDAAADPISAMDPA